MKNRAALWREGSQKSSYACISDEVAAGEKVLFAMRLSEPEMPSSGSAQKARRRRFMSPLAPASGRVAHVESRSEDISPQALVSRNVPRTTGQFADAF